MPCIWDNVHLPPLPTRVTTMSSEPFPPESSLFLLCLVSHSKTPPLHPKPALKFDLRSVPNPSRAIRQTSTGKHWALRKELLKDPVFQAELVRAQDTIREAIATFDVSRSPTDSIDRSVDTDKAIEESQDPKEKEETSTSANVLLVSCFCDMGKHRSPAFVEALAETGKWPRHWHIKTIHRELDAIADTQEFIAVPRRDRKSRKQKQKRSSRFPVEEDEHNGF